jgi:regulator of protease activity HflC (stomatin/prohibitin superfamily)
MKTEEAKAVGCLGMLAISMIFGALCLAAWGCPRYEVWRKGLAGEAQLREAESSRRISVEEAKAKLDAAKSLAQAEVERARGVAEANKIIGASLAGNEAYLRYLWIQGLENGSAPTIVYVPTEAGLPLLEASRFNRLPEGGAGP